MKLSRPNVRVAHSAPADVQRFLDDEIAKIVADINDHRPEDHRPERKPRGSGGKGTHRPAKAA